MAHERVANSLNAVFGLAHLLEDDEVGDFASTILVELLEVSQSLTSRGSEKHSSHTVRFTIFDCASNELKVSVHKRLLHFDLVFPVSVVHTDWHSTLELRDHILDKLDDLKIILEFVDI